MSGSSSCKQFERGLLHAGREEHVLAAVAGDAQLGQAENADAGLAQPSQRGPNVPGVGVPGHRRLIQRRGGQANSIQRV